MVNSPTDKLVGSETPLALRISARGKSSEKAKGPIAGGSAGAEYNHRELPLLSPQLTESRCSYFARLFL
jgi:hypothetical protein